MNRMYIAEDKHQYLDVSEYLIKAYSPPIKLKSFQTPQVFWFSFHIQYYIIFLMGLLSIIHVQFGCVTLSFYFRQSQPQLQQFVLEDLSNFEMSNSYYMNPLPIYDQKDSYDICDVYVLEGNENVQLVQQKRYHKSIQNYQQSSIPIQIFPTAYTIENEYDSILDLNQCYMEEYYYDGQQFENEDQQQEAQQIQQLQDEDIIEKYDSQEDKQQITQYSVNKNEVTSEEWQLQNPKNKIIQIISQVNEINEDLSDGEKLQIIKRKIKYYLFQNQYYIFNENLKDISGYSIKNTINQIIKGIQQSFSKDIGKLSFQKRRLKILKYMEKKKVRDWRKKVNYNCRKDVADKRLRIKGKFVTQQQALQQLGIQSLQGFSFNDLKQLLQKKMDQQ